MWEKKLFNFEIFFFLISILLVRQISHENVQRHSYVNLINLNVILISKIKLVNEIEFYSNKFILKKIIFCKVHTMKRNSNEKCKKPKMKPALSTCKLVKHKNYWQCRSLFFLCLCLCFCLYFCLCIFCVHVSVRVFSISVSFCVCASVPVCVCVYFCFQYLI